MITLIKVPVIIEHRDPDPITGEPRINTVIGYIRSDLITGAYSWPDPYIDEHNQESTMVILGGGREQVLINMLVKDFLKLAFGTEGLEYEIQSPPEKKKDGE